VTTKITRAAFSVALLAALLSACGEGNSDGISGKNTLLSGSAVGVLDADGNDITEINDTNFERPVDPEPTPAPNPTNGGSTTGANDGADFGNNENVTPYEPPEDERLSFQPGFFLKNRLAILTLDSVTNPVVQAFEALTETVVPEYQAAANQTIAVTPATQNIINRLTDKTVGCTAGDISSSIVLNSAGVLEVGSMIYSDCQRLYHTLNGTLELRSGGGSTLNVKLIDFQIKAGTQGTLVLNGDLEIDVDGNNGVLGGNSTVRTNNLVMLSDGDSIRWQNLSVTGSRDPNSGRRRLSGYGDMVHNRYGELSFNVPSPTNTLNSDPLRDVFDSGDIFLTHEDGSRMTISMEYDTFNGNPVKRMKHDSSKSGEAPVSSYVVWQHIRTRIPMADY